VEVSSYSGSGNRSTFRLDDGLYTGDPKVRRVIFDMAGRETGGELTPYLHAARRVRDASSFGRSIDNVLHQSDDPLVSRIGKIAIANEILKAEAESLFQDGLPLDMEQAIPEIAKTWLLPLAQILTTDVTVTNVAEIFAHLSIITFNYDRSLELFLPEMLRRVYGLDSPLCHEIARKVPIHHPYGQVGQLTSTHQTVGWGQDNERLEEIALYLRTFAESTDEDDALQAIRDQVAEAEVIVFLGFGFHRQNMQLLAPTTQMNVRRLIGTSLDQPSPAVEVIKSSLERMITMPSTRLRPRLELSAISCASLMHNYSLPLMS